MRKFIREKIKEEGFENKQVKVDITGLFEVEEFQREAVEMGFRVEESEGTGVYWLYLEEWDDVPRVFRSDANFVKEKIRNHILNYFTRKHGYENILPIVNLARQLQYMGIDRSLNTRCRELVEGGTFLIYNDEMREFLDSLLLVNQGYKDSPYEMYLHLISREVYYLYMTYMEIVENTTILDTLEEVGTIKGHIDDSTLKKLESIGLRLKYVHDFDGHYSLI